MAEQPDPIATSKIWPSIGPILLVGGQAFLSVALSGQHGHVAVADAIRCRVFFFLKRIDLVALVIGRPISNFSAKYLSTPG